MRTAHPESNNGAGTAICEVVGPGAWPRDWVRQLVALWEPHGMVTHGKLGKALLPLRGRYRFEEIERALVVFLDGGCARFGPTKFTETIGDLVVGRPAGNGRPSPAQLTARAVMTIFGAGR